MKAMNNNLVVGVTRLRIKSRVTLTVAALETIHKPLGLLIGQLSVITTDKSQAYSQYSSLQRASTSQQAFQFHNL